MATASTPTPAELQALILQLQTQVATLTSGAATAGPAPAAVVFADTPQSLYANDLIDYSTKRGSSIYEQGCKTLDDKALTNGFSMTPNHQMVVFVEALTCRATVMGWNTGSMQITTFINSKFDKNYTQLLARGATVNDPVGLLFEAYHVVGCYNFKTYIKRHYDEYLDGKLIRFTHKTLMTSAMRKYDWLRQKGQWGAKSPDDEKIVAMATQLETLKGHLKADKSLEDALNDDKKMRDKKNRGDKTSQKEDEAWKTPCVYAVARVMSSQLPDVPSIGRPNYKPRQPHPLWKQRSLPWEVVAASSCPSLPLLTKLVLPSDIRNPMMTIIV